MNTHSKSSMKGGSEQHRRAMDYFAKKLNDNATGSVRASQGMAALLLKDKQVCHPGYPLTIYHTPSLFPATHPPLSLCDTRWMLRWNTTPALP